jgi:hypothetical protein
MKKSILFAVVTIMFVSCGNHRTKIIKSDTARYGIIMRNNPDIKQFFPRARYMVRQISRLSKDSSSLETTKDTLIVSVYDAKDTARYPDHRPIYDSARKAYKFDSAWQEIPSYDTRIPKLTIIN